MNSILENFRSWWSHISFTSPQKRSLLALSAIVVATSAFFVVRGTSQEIEVVAPELTMVESVAQVTVDVAGAVVNPGVYSLPINSRVIDAIKAAGDTVKGADVSDINLAHIIKDGEQAQRHHPASLSSESGESLRHVGCYSTIVVGGTNKTASIFFSSISLKTR